MYKFSFNLTLIWNYYVTQLVMFCCDFWGITKVSEWKK